MTERGRQRLQHDPHPRMDAWLIGGATDELPRDVVVHASVCPECQLNIAAFDMLGAVELERAGFPPLRPPAPERASRRGLVLAGGGVLTLSVVAVAAASVWRLGPLQGAGAAGSDAPTQQVLGNTGQPEHSPATEASALSSASASASATASAGETPAYPTATLPLIPVITPAPSSPPRTHRPTPTAEPSINQPSPSPSPTPTPTATPSPTPEPATPTPTPTVEATPSSP